MSQDFKLKFDKLKENNPIGNEGEETGSQEKNSAGSAQAKTLSFLWPDGKRLFLNYSYLVSGEYVPADSTITLTFTSHLVVLKGNHLDEVFEQLMTQSVKLIVCADERYMHLASEVSIVYEITVEKV